MSSVSVPSAWMQRPAPPEPPPADGKDARYLWIFIAVQIVAQLLLLIPSLGPLRMFCRLAAFGTSIYFLWSLPVGKNANPAAKVVRWVIGLYILCLANWSMNTPLSAMAQVGLNVAIMAPVFWVARLPMSEVTLRKALLLFWAFHACSSTLGVVQTYIPGFLQPPVSTVVSANEVEGYVESLMITTASGDTVFRPMGLTDIPGGAANSAYYTILLGLGFFLNEKGWLKRLMFLGTMLLGVTALLLSQVRALVVILAVGLLVIVGLLALRREVKKLMIVSQLLGIAAVVGFIAAVAIGGESVTGRLETLVEDDATEVYRSNRGGFLQYTIDVLLPDYPFGAGLGRWGMMNAYFGDNSDPTTQAIWVEIQVTGWLLDGGVPMIALYYAAVITAILVTLSLVKTSKTVWLWAAILVAYDVGILALTFSYPVFIGNTGLEFWLLNTAVFTAAQTEARRNKLQQEQRELPLLSQPVSYPVVRY